MPIDPSIAFGVQRPQQSQQQSPFAMLGELMQLKETGQRIQGQSIYLKNQEQLLKDREEAQKDEAAIRQSMQKFVRLGPQGEPQDLDFDMVYHDLTAQGRGQAAISLRDKMVDIKKKEADDLKVKAETTRANLNLALSMAKGITDDPSHARVKRMVAETLGPEFAKYLGDRYDPATIQTAVDTGMSVSEMLTKRRDQFNAYKELLTESRLALTQERDWQSKLPDMYDKWLTQSAEYLSLAQNDSDWQATRSQVEGAMKGILPQQLVDSVMQSFPMDYSKGSAEAARVLSLTPGQRSQELMERARLADTQQARKENDDVPLDPAAIAMLGEKLARDGQMPPMGLGKNATRNRDLVYNYAAKVFPTLDLASQVAAVTAYKGSLNVQQRALNQIEGYETNVLKNMRQMLTEAKKIPDWGAPILNKPVREVALAFGSETIPGFRTAHGVVVPETAKILTGNPATLAGQLSDDARKEVAKLLPENYTYKQLYNAVQIIVNDMDNRKTSIQEQIGKLQGLIAMSPRTFAPGEGTNRQPQGQAAQSGLPPNYNGVVTQNGQRYTLVTDAQGRMISLTPINK